MTSNALTTAMSDQLPHLSHWTIFHTRANKDRGSWQASAFSEVEGLRG